MEKILIWLNLDLISNLEPPILQFFQCSDFKNLVRLKILQLITCVETNSTLLMWIELN